MGSGSSKSSKSISGNWSSSPGPKDGGVYSPLPLPSPLLWPLQLPWLQQLGQHHKVALTGSSREHYRRCSSCLHRSCQHIYHSIGKHSWEFTDCVIVPVARIGMERRKQIFNAILCYMATWKTIISFFLQVNPEMSHGPHAHPPGIMKPDIPGPEKLSVSHFIEHLGPQFQMWAAICKCTVIVVRSGVFFILNYIERFHKFSQKLPVDMASGGRAPRVAWVLMAAATFFWRSWVAKGRLSKLSVRSLIF